MIAYVGFKCEEAFSLYFRKTGHNEVFELVNTVIEYLYIDVSEICQFIYKMVEQQLHRFYQMEGDELQAFYRIYCKAITLDKNSGRFDKLFLF